MSRGGLGFDGIGYESATFIAGAGIKALVAAANRDAVVGVPVVVSASGTVDLGTDGDAIFGVIDVYENSGHVGVQFRGFVTNVKIGAVAPTIGKLAAVDGAGKAKDSSTTAKVKAPLFIEVNATDSVATVFLG